jgi:hypothetical protein
MASDNALRTLGREGAPVGRKCHHRDRPWPPPIHRWHAMGKPTVADHVQGAAGFQGLGERFDQGAFQPLAVLLLEQCPKLGLGVPDEGEELTGIERQLPVEVLRVALRS